MMLHVAVTILFQYCIVFYCVKLSHLFVSSTVDGIWVVPSFAVLRMMLLWTFSVHPFGIPTNILLLDLYLRVELLVNNRQSQNAYGQWISRNFLNGYDSLFSHQQHRRAPVAPQCHNTSQFKTFQAILAGVKRCSIVITVAIPLPLLWNNCVYWSVAILLGMCFSKSFAIFNQMVFCSDL